MVGAECLICGKRIYRYYNAANHLMRHGVNPTERALEDNMRRINNLTGEPIEYSTDEEEAEIRQNQPAKLYECRLCQNEYRTRTRGRMCAHLKQVHGVPAEFYVHNHILVDNPVYVKRKVVTESDWVSSDD